MIMITAIEPIPPNTPPRIRPVILFPLVVDDPPTHIHKSYVCIYLVKD